MYSAAVCLYTAYFAVRMKLPPSAESETSPADNASSQQDVDFSDYMWMGEEMEEFDSKVIIVLVYPSRFSFEYYTM